MTQHINGYANGNGNGHSHANGNGNGASSSASPLYTVPPGHLLLHLSAGRTASFSLPSYPAASFYLYIPSSHPVSRRKRGESSTTPQHRNGHGVATANGHAEKRYPLVVCMHGSSRDAEGVRNRWSDLAEREGFVVLAPLFPVDMDTVDGMHNYKLIRYPLYGHGQGSRAQCTRFDHLLLEMIDLVDERWGYIDTDRFGLTGYSGGAQFAHRFFYLHPERVHTLSVGAPGMATPLDPGLPWPLGVSDFEDHFCRPIDVPSLRHTRTQLLVGLDDTWRPTSNDGSTPPMNRIDGMRMLRDDWIPKGIHVEYEELEGVAHEETDVIHRVQAFILRGQRAESSKAHKLLS